MTEECGNCRFWLRRTDHAEDVGGGYCRRYPPFFPSALEVIGVRQSNKLADIELSGSFLNDAWPNTHQGSWCGEWQARS